MLHKRKLARLIVCQQRSDDEAVRKRRLFQRGTTQQVEWGDALACRRSS